MSNQRLVLIQQLYLELRFYRHREFLVFVFTFLVAGSPFALDTLNRLATLVVATIVVVTMTRYLVLNHRRMMTIKREIVAQQELAELNESFQHLNPNQWTRKSNLRHLGTGTYIFLLMIEMLGAWVTFFLN